MHSDLFAFLAIWLFCLRTKNFLAFHSLAAVSIFGFDSLFALSAFDFIQLLLILLALDETLGSAAASIFTILVKLVAGLALLGGNAGAGFPGDDFATTLIDCRFSVFDHDFLALVGFRAIFRHAFVLGLGGRILALADGDRFAFETIPAGLLVARALVDRMTLPLAAAAGFDSFLR